MNRFCAKCGTLVDEKTGKCPKCCGRENKLKKAIIIATSVLLVLSIVCIGVFVLSMDTKALVKGSIYVEVENVDYSKAEIVFENKETKETFTVVPDENGEYEIYLPYGEYQSYVNYDGEVVYEDELVVEKKTKKEKAKDSEIKLDFDVVVEQEDKYFGYEEVIQEYIEKFPWQESPIEIMDIGEVSYLYRYSSQLDEIGYAFYDVDSNGQVELLLSEIKEEYNRDVVFDMYTIVDGEIVLLCSSGERDRYSICSDGSIYNCGSSGAVSSSYSKYVFAEDCKSLELVERVEFNGYCAEEKGLISEAFEADGDTGYFVTDTEDYSDYDKYVHITQAEAEEKIDSMEEVVIVADYTPLSQFEPSEKQSKNNDDEYTAQELAGMSLSQIVDILGPDFEIATDGEYLIYYTSPSVHIYNFDVLPGYIFYIDGINPYFESESDIENERQKIIDGEYDRVSFIGLVDDAKLDSDVSADMTYNELTQVYGDFEMPSPAGAGTVCYSEDNVVLCFNYKDIADGDPFSGNGYTVQVLKKYNPPLEYIICYPQ